ncbi:MAG TPA: hypothetical protein VGW11_05890, partial [Solirubrobacteraceae bacterium]|nr:hypothetical protein [Solirubrobacteraceae bacterium]
TEHDGGSRVWVETDYTITGRLARFGRGGMIEDVSKRLLTDFATCLQEPLGAAAVTGGDLQEPAVPPPAPEAAAIAPEAPTPQATGVEVGGGAQAARSQAPGPPPSATPAPRPSAHRPAQARPLNALALLLSVLRDRIKALVARVRDARSG